MPNKKIVAIAVGRRVVGEHLCLGIVSVMEGKPLDGRSYYFVALMQVDMNGSVFFPDSE
ncbi:MAG: hypothetical protein QM653_07175 [Dysgonomonas sp.]|uniref:hypothetical protein n=1 Tax=Dysgonomonas sp. TaxID=1891233 RepID=UPI0039E33CD0